MFVFSLNLVVMVSICLVCHNNIVYMYHTHTYTVYWIYLYTCMYNIPVCTIYLYVQYTCMYNVPVCIANGL